MLVRVGCTFSYTADWPTPALVLIAARNDDLHRILEEDRFIEPAVAVHDFLDSFGNRIWRLTFPVGTVHITYDALIELTAEPDPSLLDAMQTPIEDIPDSILSLTFPSRHCQSDLLSATAWELFGSSTPGWPRVQAISDWLHTHIAYQVGSIHTTSALDAFEARAGVCRDFAHLGVTFCRAMNIPARYVFGYLPDVGIIPPDVPMDFHAWFEAYVDGQWRTFDARHNQPRIGRIPVGRGRDAVDVAMTTTYGAVRLEHMEVWTDEVDQNGLVLSGLNKGKTLLPRRLLEVAR